MTPLNKTSAAVEKVFAFLNDARLNPLPFGPDAERELTFTNREMEAVMEKYKRMEEALGAIARHGAECENCCPLFEHVSTEALSFDPLSHE